MALPLCFFCGTLLALPFHIVLRLVPLLACPLYDGALLSIIPLPSFLMVCSTFAPLLLQGITASLVRTVPNGAMALCSYEFFVRLLSQLIVERAAR